jgi:predicted alpha/beta-fold hydrolase
MTYVYNKYCQNRKVYAVGTSMGANILSNMMGFAEEDCFIDGACVVQAPIKKWECSETIRTSMFGVYNKALGSNLKKAFLKHEPMLKDVFREKVGFDMLEYVE